MKTCILETFGVKQGTNTSFKKFLTETRRNCFICGFWVGQNPNKGGFFYFGQNKVQIFGYLSFSVESKALISRWLLVGTRGNFSFRGAICTH